MTAAADVLKNGLLQVAELRENGELVGVIRGCIKHVGTKFGEKHVKLGCILGLRVSPRHRRMGIGLKLVGAMEEWLVSNGADYTFLATEKNNVASTNLFTAKCNYRNLSSLVIFVQPISFAMEGERLGELMKSAWNFASRLAENVKDCKVIITELGVSDPLIEHVPHEPSMSRIDDLWYLKKVNRSSSTMDEEINDLAVMGELGNVVVDPRDF
ncbi:hypothetical protein COLO4_34621 [Corchorus olitorius]|uniref:N-acetyltransferase domain-containing protein n=1 Tax=Corchorus olitorius TaxID=93759 RepID=A0A1R3GK56_9ROSI|nr:hypothetical protein COLO4_34621 [Corchorus olitorius]